MCHMIYNSGPRTGAGAGGAGPAIAGPIFLKNIIIIKIQHKVKEVMLNKKRSIHTCVCTRTHNLSLRVHQCRQLIKLL